MRYSFEIECVESKRFHETVFRVGERISRPIFSLFIGGERRMAAMLRTTKGSEDKQDAFKEVFSFIPTIRADDAFIGFDSWLGSDVDTYMENETMPTDSVDALQCFTMHRGDFAAKMKVTPYVIDRHHDVYYVMSSVLPDVVEVDQGIICDLMRTAFEITESPYNTPADHAKALADLGHAVALYPYGEKAGPRLY